MSGRIAVGVVVALSMAVVGPAAAQPSEVAVPPRGETAVEVLGDGRRVWVVHQDDGDVVVLDVTAERLHPDADPLVHGSSFTGVRGLTAWIPQERLFLGPAVSYDEDGRALSWSPNQVGGAEDAGPVPAQDLDRYAAERVDEDTVAVGERTAGGIRTVPAGSTGAVDADGLVFAVAIGERGMPVEEALELPAGRTALVDADLVVADDGPVRLCDLPAVPIPELPACPDDSPVPAGVATRASTDGVLLVEFGPHLLTRTAEGFSMPAGAGGTAFSAFSEGQVGPGFDGDRSTLDRITAEDPVSLGVAVSRARFADGTAAEAVLVRADDPADATTASVLTGGAPLLFTTRDALPDATRQELARVLPRDAAATVFVVGGPTAVDDAVVTQLRADGYTIDRVAGPSRVETAIEVAERARYGSESIISPVLLARSQGTVADPTSAWADSVTAGGYAARYRSPILLTPSEELHPAVAQALRDFRTDQTVLLGGTAALSEAVEAAVPGPWRVAGTTRAGTAAAIARDLWPFTTGRAVLFDGAAIDGWQAGLAAAGLSAQTFAPLLLAGGAVPPETRAALDLLCPTGATDLVAVGGVAIDPMPACEPDAPAEVRVVVTVDSRQDTPEEDARVEVQLRNGTGAPLEVSRYEIARTSSDAPARVHEPVRSGALAPDTAPAGATIDVDTLDPVGPAQLGGGSSGTTAGPYQASVLTSAGWARATFYVEFSTPLDF